MAVLMESHPTWVRGLKLNIAIDVARELGVAPYVGAWIETVMEEKVSNLMVVAPYVGAWIETVSSPCRVYPHSPSHPTWVRGLKQGYTRERRSNGKVAPYVGAWIETFLAVFDRTTS